MGYAQEVQGHIAKTDIDPGASPAWLAIESDLLCNTPGSGVALKRVFKPFDWNLRIYNSAAIANATPNGARSSAGCCESRKTALRILAQALM